MKYLKRLLDYITPADDYGRIALHQLLGLFSKDLIQDANADAGALVFIQGDEHWLIAKATRNTMQTRIYAQSEPCIPARMLPWSILQAVAQSASKIVLPNPALFGAFQKDPYFASHFPQRVLCLPCKTQDHLIGLLYLESERPTQEFSPECIAMLEARIASAFVLPEAIVAETARICAAKQEGARFEHALASSEATIRDLVDILPIAVYVCDANGVIERYNRSAIELWGREPLLGDARERYCGSYRLYTASGITLPHTACPMAETLRTGIPELNREIIVERPDGSRRNVIVNVIGRTDELGHITGAINCMTDITDRIKAEENIRYMAYYDDLTGLPNRIMLQDRLHQALTVAQRNRSQVALLFIDLDNFKHINDSRGHLFGDRLLQLLAQRLRHCVRDADSIGRLGGDEFVLVLPLCSGNNDALLVANKVLSAVKEPYVVDDHELHISVSIGISLFPDDGFDVESLMRAADTAMYHAKAKGRNNCQFFTAELNRAAQNRFAMENRLRQALAQHELHLFYQPQIDMRSGRIIGAEALLRWTRGQQPVVSGGCFIALAEETGLILTIGEWILREACGQLKKWHDAGHTDFKLAVNISGHQLHQPDFVTSVQQLLADTGAPASALNLEITESVLIQHSASNLSALNELSKLGIKLSIDDFGTGYSSLSYLQRFPIHALKIDQSFVQGLAPSGKEISLITAIIAMAHSLQLDVIAEGVETFEQTQLLLARNCTLAQGFFYSEAVSAEALSPMLCSPKQIASRNRAAYDMHLLSPP